MALVVALALAASGCGGGSTDPRAEALSYLPKSAPVVVLIQTDPGGAQIGRTESLLRHLRGGTRLLDLLRSMFERSGLSYERDLKPLLGNDIALGVPSVGATHDTPFVASVVAADRRKLDALVKRTVREGRWRPTGDYLGAALYRSQGRDVYAVRDATLVVARTIPLVKAALDRHDGGDVFTPNQFDEGLGDLPRDALMRVYVDVRAALAVPSAARARRIPWVAALRTLGITFSTEGSAFRVRYRLDTSGRALSDADVPIATGAATPRLYGPAPVVIGVRDVAHLVRFAERAAAAVNPTGAAVLEGAKALIRVRYGIDLERDVVGQLGGASLSTNFGRGGAVVELRDPGAMARALEKLQPVINSALAARGLPYRLAPQGPARWTISVRGRRVGSLGVVGGKLVIGSVGFPVLRRLAATPVPTPTGTHGSIALRIRPGGLAALLAQPPRDLSALEILLSFTGGFVSATTRELRGELRVDVGRGTGAPAVAAPPRTGA